MVMRPQLHWTILSTDRDGKPTCRVCRLPRLTHPGLAIWHERGLYTIMSVDRRGVCQSTGFTSRTVRGILALLDVCKPSAIEHSAPEPSELVSQCAQLFTRGALLGARVSVGRHTPAVPDGYSWCVLDFRGAPLWLGHDPVAGLAIFRWWESLTADGLEERLESYRQEPARDWTDERIEAADLADRRIDLELRGYLPRESEAA